MGCRLIYSVEDNRIVRISPDPEDPVSHGMPCPKGLFINTLAPDRVTTPLVKSSSRMDEVSWDYALELMTDKLSNVDPSETGWIGSGEITNEDNYAISKFAKGLGSGNIDSCARLCHSPTVDVFNETLGIPASPGRLDEILDLDALLLVGTNPAATYPVMFHRIQKAKEKGMKLLVISPFEDETSAHADYNAIMRLDYAPFFLLGVLDRLVGSLSSNLPGFQDLLQSIKDSREVVRELFSNDIKEEIKRFSDVILDSKKFGVAHGMGITQTYNGLDTIRTLVSIALLKDGLVLTNRGKINIQGAGDVGIFPGVGGKTLVDFLLLDPVKFVFSSIFNPALSMPDLESTRKNLSRIFLVQATPYKNETSTFANIILPTPLLYERRGTVTTGENRVRFVRRVLSPPKQALQEWEILSRVGKWGYKDVSEITHEITSSNPRYKGVNVKALYSGKDQFVETQVKPRFSRINSRIERYDGFPFVLITWRKLSQFNTGDLTGTSEIMNRIFSSRAVAISERDALRMGLKTGDKVIVESPSGSLEAEVKVVYGKIPDGLLVASFHFKDFPVNVLTPRLFNESKTPSYKIIPVRLKKLSGEK